MGHKDTKTESLPGGRQETLRNTYPGFSSLCILQPLRLRGKIKYEIPYYTSAVLIVQNKISHAKQ